MALLPNFLRLLIPHKADGHGRTPVTYETYGTDMRAIERWAQNVVMQLEAGTGITLTPTSGRGPTVKISASSSGYASLTGPGQTTTPGALTQAGGWTVNAGTAGISENSTNTPIVLTVTNGTGATSSLTLRPVVAGNPSIDLVAQGGYVTVSANGQGRVFIGASGDLLGFFSSGGGGAVRQTVTGSKGGNVALANLLSALASYNLIVDSTT